MSIELINKDRYSIEIERKEDRVNILLVENEAFGERILVGAEEREEFLTPWINMLIRYKRSGNQRNNGPGKETGAHRAL
ncbi:MAG: hypothetical protein ACLUE2_12615 [Bacteroides cellulosilyticus]